MPRLTTLKPEAPYIAGNGENLQVYLDEVNSDRIRERIGKETEVSHIGFIQVTRGTGFKVNTPTGIKRITGMRYLHRNRHNEIIGAVNLTMLNRQTIVVSNIYVRPDCRLAGIASALIAEIQKTYPHLVVDNSMTCEGAAFFGYAPEYEPGVVEHGPTI